MITISTNENNDIYLDTSGNIALSQDIYALANISKNKGLTTLGEPEYNQLDGIPYFETVFTDTPKIDLFQAAMINAMESLDGVETVSDFEYEQKDGIFSYTLTEQTIYGDIQING